MKVLQLTTQSATAYRFAMPLAKYLRDNGYHVTIGCSCEPQKDVPVYCDAIEQQGFPLLNVPIPRQVRPIADIRALRTVIELLRQQRFEIIHTHNSKAGMIGRVAARLTGVPYILHTNHGLPFFKADKFSLWQSLLYWMMEAVAVRFTDRVLAVSSAEFKKAQAFKIAHPPKLINIGQGVNTDFYSKRAIADAECTQRVRQLRKQLAGRPVVGAVGRLVSEKGIDCLLEAVAICVKTRPDLAVLVLGEGPEREMLEQRALELGIDGDVRFLGFIRDFREVRQFYSLMDIFVLPTRWESFGVVFAEAMSMEVPVIGSKIEPITSVVSDGETGHLVPLDDVPGFAEAILDLLSNPDKRAEMGQAGRRRVIDLWDERKMLARVESVYRELASNRTVPGAH